MTPQQNLYTIGQTYWPPSEAPGSRYNCRYGFHELALYHHPIDQQFISDFNTGPIEFSHWKDDPVLWLLYRVQGSRWADAPFTIHHVHPAERRNPPLDPEHSRYALTCLLVDCATSHIAALRVATIPPKTSAALHAAIADQLHQPFSAQDFREHVHRTYRRFPDTEEMLAYAPFVERLGT